MPTTTTRIEDLLRRASQAGMRVCTYRPGDGTARYRFFRYSDNSTFFGPSDGLFTALGISEAETYVAGVLMGRALFFSEERELAEIRVGK